MKFNAAGFVLAFALVAAPALADDQSRSPISIHSPGAARRSARSALRPTRPR